VSHVTLCIDPTPFKERRSKNWARPTHP